MLKQCIDKIAKLLLDNEMHGVCDKNQLNVING